MSAAENWFEAYDRSELDEEIVPIAEGSGLSYELLKEKPKEQPCGRLTVVDRLYYQQCCDKEPVSLVSRFHIEVGNKEQVYHREGLKIKRGDSWSLDYGWIGPINAGTLVIECKVGEVSLYVENVREQEVYSIFSRLKPPMNLRLPLVEQHYVLASDSPESSIDFWIFPK